MNASFHVTAESQKVLVSTKTVIRALTGRGALRRYGDGDR